MATTSPAATRSLLVLLLSGALACAQSTPPSRSFSNPDSEAAELRAVLSNVMGENEHLQDEVAELKEKLKVSEAATKRVTESLAVTNAEAEVFRRQSGELKLKLEALGVSGSQGDGKLEQRLLTAVNDLHHTREANKSLTEALLAVTEASMALLKAPEASQQSMRLALEKELQRANILLGQASPNAVEGRGAPATLTDGMVISLKDELSLIVTNVGSKQGVTVGMPFQVLRGERVIGLVRIVDVRERIAGAIIQNLSSDRERIKVGDRLKIAARQ